MLRWINRVAVVVSMLLLVISMAAWVGSYFRQEIVAFHQRRNWTAPFRASAAPDMWAGSPHIQLIAFVADRGTVAVIEYRVATELDLTASGGIDRFESCYVPWKHGLSAALRPLEAKDEPFWFRLSKIDSIASYRRLKLRPEADTIGFNGTWYSSGTITIPIWMLSVLFAAWPLVSVIFRLISARRIKSGCCSHCGYDLRATPQRCPECGKSNASRSG